MKRAIFSVCCIMISLLMILNTFRKVSGTEGEATLQSTLEIIAEYDWGFSKTYEQIAQAGKAWEELTTPKYESGTKPPLVNQGLLSWIVSQIVGAFDKSDSVTNGSLFDFLNALIETIKVPFVAIGELLKETYNGISLTFKLLGITTFEGIKTPTTD